MRSLRQLALVAFLGVGCGDAEPVEGPEQPIVSNECESHPDCREYSTALGAPTFCGPRELCVLYEIECETVDDCAPWTWYDYCSVAGFCRHSYRDDPR